ncbi:MAG: phytanoyl-CoA dioxygenase family protein [Planctomycetota bacterium]|nr:phytanoyl-CoA dioxygenase family protein [Planctomycetota bacterium]
MSASVAVSQVPVQELEVFADDLDIEKAAAIYREHGALVVRGLMKPYLKTIAGEIERKAQEAIALLPQAKKIVEGWTVPNGTLFLPAPPGFKRDRQIMVLGYNYHASATFFRSALDERTLALVKAVLGENIELFGNGQCLYKEPVGGHPKHLHQDAAYFEHKYEGPMAMLNYVVDTDLLNGALHVVPGSHRFGVLNHVDTFSHLGLDEREWPWERATPVCGQAGDSIFFHVKTIHGSKENHSTQPRPVFIHRYRRSDDYTVVSATTAANRAENEKHREERKKENQLGFMLSGFRAWEARD